MGLSSIFLQITVLRQLLSTFSGNELNIGITLSVWLVTVGIGSYTGWRLRYEKAFAVSFLAVALLSQPTIILINAIRPILSLEIGETVSITATLASTVLSLLPLCLVLGFQFPLAVSHLKGSTTKVYSVEAAAAFIGGALFTFAVSGRMNSHLLAGAISAVNILAALYLIRKKSILLFFLVPLFLYYGAFETALLSQWKGMTLINKIESRYGEIAVTRMKGQSNIYLSGKLEFSYPDPQTEELKAHLPMSVHPDPKQLLVIGGSPAVLRELLKYDVEKIDFVEIDPALTRASLDLLDAEDREVLKDKRARIITADARKYVKSQKGTAYDLIVLNLPEPATANINRFYTVDFFREAKAVLKGGGIIFLTLPAASGYIGKRMQLANGTIYNSLGNVFGHLEASSEEYGSTFASDSPLDINPKTLERRFSQRTVKTGYFHPYIFMDAFSPLKVSMVKSRLSAVNAVNTDLKPLAYLYNLMLWGEIHGGKIWSIFLELSGWQVLAGGMVIALFAAVFSRGKAESVYYSVFTTGYAGMAFSLIIILTYQAAYGYVYEMFGLLTATFMIGIATGAYIAGRIRRPLALLRFFNASLVALFISSPLFFKEEPLFYILSFLCGLFAGGEFAAANLYIEQEASRLAGRLYGIDLAGSFIGAFLTAILLIPLLGIQNAIVFIALLKALSFILLLTINYEKG